LIKIITKNNEAASYTKKSEVVCVLQKAVLNGEELQIQNQHIENMKDMLGKDRIFE
jgi:hypothetical protein